MRVSPATTSTHDVLPPTRAVSGPGEGQLPRTPQKRIDSDMPRYVSRRRAVDFAQEKRVRSPPRSALDDQDGLGGPEWTPGKAKTAAAETLGRAREAMKLRFVR